MAESELEKAFGTLAQAFSLTESEIGEEISVVQQQIDQLKERIVELNTRQQTLVHDRDSISEMYQRYCDTAGQAVEF
ncbi:MAG: hypothetical protein K2W82_18340 [Candidatus Obscuribacterales bacterium]|nr:hypothetical protein [Candidatus Obscuribacterales bacterium]